MGRHLVGAPASRSRSGSRVVCHSGARAARRCGWRAACALLAACAASAAGAADVFVSPPPFNPAPTEQVAFELLVDMGPDVLGSYLFTLQYDPAVVHVFGVAGGTTAEFSAPPTTDPASFSSGSTPLAAAQGSSVSPSGFLSVATVTLEAVGLPADSSDLDLPAVSMFDAQFDAVSATVFPSTVLIAVPEVPSDLVFVDGQTLAWTDLSDIPGYNLYRGSLGGTFAFDHACRQPDLPTADATEPEDPTVPGTGFYYLVSAVRNGVEGTLGVTSSGQFRPNLSPCLAARSTDADAPDDAPTARLLVLRPVSSGSRSAAPTSPAPTAPVVPPVLAASGDVDGDGLRTDRDAAAILETLVGVRTLDGAARDAADVTGDGRVDPADAQMLRRFLAGGGEPALPAPAAAWGATLGSADCSGVDLLPGLNAVRMRCIPDGYSAFRLLSDLGATDGEAVQSWDAATGRYRTARWEHGAPAGDDFPIRPVERYLILSNLERFGFVAAPAAGGK